MDRLLSCFTKEASYLTISALSRRAESYSLEKEVKESALLRSTLFVAQQIFTYKLLKDAFKTKNEMHWNMLLWGIPCWLYLSYETDLYFNQAYPAEEGSYFWKRVPGYLVLYQKTIRAVAYAGFFYKGDAVTAVTGFSCMIYTEVKNNTVWLHHLLQKVVDSIIGIADLFFIAYLGSKEILGGLFIAQNSPKIWKVVTASPSSIQKKVRFNPSWGTNLITAADRGELFPCEGRDELIYQMKAALLQDRVNNPLLIGPSGSGKTSVVHALAQQIADGLAGEEFKDYEIIEVNINELMKDAKWVGGLNKAVGLLEAASQKNPKLIFFIDEIHNIVGQGKSHNSNTDILNMLKTALTKDTFKVIGATTPEEYTIIENADAAERRFLPVNVSVFSKKEACDVILRVKHKYEQRYNCIITEEAVNKAVEFGVNSRMLLPGSALKLLSNAAARISMSDRSAKKNNGIKPSIASADINPVTRVHTRKSSGDKTGLPPSRGEGIPFFNLPARVANLERLVIGGQVP